MPIIPAIVSFAVSSIAGGAIASAVAGLGLTGVSASIVSGAITGGISGGISAGITGGNVGKGILGGAVSGGVGGGVTNALSTSLSPGMSSIDLQGANYLKPEFAGSQALGAGISKGLGSLAGGTAGALVTGQPLSSALRTGLIGGLGSGLGAGFGTAADLSPTEQSILGGAVSYGLGRALQPTGQSQQVYAPSQTAALGTSGVQRSVAQPSGTSSALGSALFAAPGFGYSPGGPVLGGSGGEDKAPKNVWSESDKSLRDVGSTVT
jgi:hypothetical protein